MTSLSPVLAQSPPRRTLAKAISAILAIFVVMSILYATLPVWLPATWIQERVARQLSRDIQYPVSIGKTTLSWSGGVELRDVRIGEMGDATQVPLAHLHSIRTSLDPLRMLFQTTSGRISVDGADVFLQVDSQGRIRNLHLPTNRYNSAPPFSVYEIQDLSCHVLSEAGDRVSRLDRVECRLDADTGQMKLQVAARDDTAQGRSSGSFLLNAGLTLTSLQPDQPFGGKVHVSWKRLALNELPLALLPQLPIARIDGLTSGDLTLLPQSDLSLDFDLLLQLDAARLVRDLNVAHPAGVDANLHATGRWDPSADQIELKEFGYETPGLLLHRPSEGPVLAIDSRGTRPFHLRLAGRVKNWAALSREMPELEHFLASSQSHVSGRADFTLELVQQKQEDRLLLSVDAKDTALAIGSRQPFVAAGAGVPKSIYVETVYSESRRHLSQPEVRLTLGGSTLTLRSELSLPTSDPADRVGWLADAAGRLSWRMMFSTNDIAQISQFVPALAKLNIPADGQGPLRIAAVSENHGDTTEIRLSLDVPEQTTLEIGDIFRKPEGERFDALAAFSISRGAAQFTAKGEAALGDLAISLKETPIRYRLWEPDSIRSVDHVASVGSFNAEMMAEPTVHVSHVEKLASVCPRLSRIVPKDLKAGGSLEVESKVRFSRHADDWALCTAARVQGRALAIEHPLYLHKPADEPLDIAFTHRVSVFNGQREQSAGLDVHTRPVHVCGNIDFAGLESADSSDDFEQLKLSIDVSDAAQALAMAPGLALSLGSTEAKGRLHIQLSDFLSSDSENLNLQVDATDAEFRIAGENPIQKTSGVPASVNLEWRGAPDPADATSWNFKLVQGRVDLPGLHLDQVKGEARTRRISRSLAGIGALPLRDSAAFRDGRLSLRGLITFDGPLREMSPSIRQLIEKYHLSGSSEYELEADLLPDRMRLSGKLRADELSFVSDLNFPSVPLLRKPTGMPGLVRFETEVARTDRGEVSLRLQRADLEIAGNKADCTGTLFLTHAAGVASISRAALSTHFNLADSEGLAQLLPDSTWRVQGGSCEGSVQLGGSADTLAARAGQIIFKNMAIRTPDEPMKINGTLSLDDQRLLADHFAVRWGSSDVDVSGAISVGSKGSRGHLTLALSNCDLPDLQKRFAKLNAESNAAPSAAHDDKDKLDPHRIVEYLRNSEFSVSASAGTATFDLPLGVPVTTETGTMRAEVNRGMTSLSFQGTVNGGMVTGQVSSDLNSDDPQFHLTYSAEKIQPSPLVDRYLGLTFPGMQATGPLTLIDETTQKIFPAPGELNFPVGKGDMMIDGGTIEGRAAPDWLAKIFPKLNLSSFDFTYMHSWFDKTVDGRIRHQMIYRGKFYNVYASGFGEDDGHIDYEVGIDFLANFDSHYWAESGQGRIPLFRKTGVRNSSGKLDDEVVSYTPPQRVLDALLVKNNPLVTAYHAVRKRVLHEQ